MIEIWGFGIVLSAYLFITSLFLYLYESFYLLNFATGVLMLICSVEYVKDKTGFRIIG